MLLKFYYFGLLKIINYIYINNLILYEVSGWPSASVLQFHIKNSFVLVK